MYGVLVDMEYQPCRYNWRQRRLMRQREYQHRTLQEIPHGVSDSCIETIKICVWKLSLVGAATSIIFVTTKVLLQQTHVCWDKHVFVMTQQVICLSWQTCVCHDKTGCLLWQKYDGHNKTFVTTKHLSQQNICCDKYLSWQT